MAKVLVADDHDDSALLACRIFESAGHQCTSAGDGRKALAAILQEVPDLLVLDLSMPGLSGVELLEVVRSYLRLQALPVVVVSGNAQSPDAARARKLGVREVLLKASFTPAGLLAAAARAMSGA